MNINEIKKIIINFNDFINYNKGSKFCSVSVPQRYFKVLSAIFHRTECNSVFRFILDREPYRDEICTFFRLKNGKYYHFSVRYNLRFFNKNGKQ